MSILIPPSDLTCFCNNQHFYILHNPYISDIPYNTKYVQKGARKYLG
jgi:hypothetical protein